VVLSPASAGAHLGGRLVEHAEARQSGDQAPPHKGRPAHLRRRARRRRPGRGETHRCTPQLRHRLTPV
ncbi:unnamed protein product, partial [Ectocarpus fasciculatus]